VQIGKALGMKVVGIAGGAEKCAFVKDELGADACHRLQERGRGQGAAPALPRRASTCTSTTSAARSSTRCSSACA
jgi:hypothetical protein